MLKKFGVRVIYRKIRYFALRIGYEKALRKMGAALAHSRSKMHLYENL
jgi:hypothetical protein